jgi:DNA-binding transcriptional ArsR family regulator
MAKRLDSVDAVLAALADPTRRAMVDRLAEGPASVSELARPFAIALPTATKHLAVLSAAGLVTSSKRGRVRMCRLERTALDETAAWIEARRRRWETRLDALENLIMEGPTT